MSKSTVPSENEPVEVPAAEESFSFSQWIRDNYSEVKFFALAFIIGAVAAIVVIYSIGLPGELEEQEMYVSLEKATPKVATKKSPPGGILDATKSEKDKNLWRKMIERENYKQTILFPKSLEYKNGGRLFLIIAGHVFDVSSGASMYGTGKTYHGFIGRDCTRAFITGKFDDDGCTSDVTDLDDTAIAEVGRWLGFYFTHDTYKFVGVTPGLYFDDEGQPTQVIIRLIERIKDAERQAEFEASVEKIFPPCNMEWTAASGSNLWCSQKSGGIERDWAGFPRQFTDEGKPTRCACVNKNLLNDPRVKLYEGCPIDAQSCKLKE